MSRRILMIVIDCLRADHVSAYGYARQTTPMLDRLAAGGVLWEHASSTSSWTKPSVSSLLTGLYPTEHGAFEGIKRSRGRSGVHTDVLRAAGATLAERFSNHGWRCGAFINNAQLGPFTGLDRGFERYIPDAGKADRLIGLFEHWLADDPQRPAFAYLHLLEAHWPYKPRRRHIEQFGGNRDTNVFRGYSARDFGRLRRAVSRGETALTERALEQMVQMYDGAVRRLDGKLKLVLRALERLGVRDETTVFITADHGEEFLEHGKIGHGQSLYQELVHVPLVGFGPDLPSGLRCADPVSLVNLPGTLLHVAHLNGADEPSLLTTHQRPIVAELRIRQRYTQSIRVGDWKLHRRFRSEEVEVARGEMRTCEPARSCGQPVATELYELGDDPREERDLSADPAHAARQTELVAAIEAWWEAASRRHGAEHGEADLDLATVQRLRALGYVD